VTGCRMVAPPARREGEPSPEEPPLLAAAQNLTVWSGWLVVGTSEGEPVYDLA